jgi:hypothetical protein
MKLSPPIYGAALACSLLVTAQPLQAGETRAVLELFTSQGCSSCPPADRLLGELSRDPSLITLSLPVDYWDYLGWKDTLALHGHTTRERAYAETRGDREVYTPQIVVNGSAHALGSDKAAIEAAIAHTRASAKPLSLPVTVAVADEKVVANVSAPAGESQKNAAHGEVWLCPITRKISVEVKRGENHGHNLTYYNVVRRWVKLGDWTGQSRSFSAPLAAVSGGDIDAYAVLVQSGAAGKPGPILGAAVTAAR